MESLYDVPPSNRRAAADPGDTNIHLNEWGETWIIQLFCLFSQPAVAAENIYDVPSVLLRKIPDYSLGRVSHCHFASFSMPFIDAFFARLKLSAQRSSGLRKPTGGYEAWMYPTPTSTLSH